MITSFKCKETQALFEGRISRKIASNCRRIAQRKLEMLHAATRLEDLRVPPGNRLEALKAGRARQHCIRINEQWCICFVWDNETGNAKDVAIVDYH